MHPLLVYILSLNGIGCLSAINKRPVLSLQGDGSTLFRIGSSARMPGINMYYYYRALRGFVLAQNVR